MGKIWNANMKMLIVDYVGRTLSLADVRGTPLEDVFKHVAVERAMGGMVVTRNRIGNHSLFNKTGPIFQLNEQQIEIS